MFKVFDRNHKQIDILENPYNAQITDELNGIGELTFTVPTTYKKLQLEGYIQVRDGHEYVIKEITTDGRERNVHCVLNIEELLGMVHTTFTSKENNLDTTMQIILNGTTWTHVNNSTRAYTRNLYGTVVSSYHMLQLMSTVFDVEFYFDTYKKIVYIVDRVGEDNGTYFINELNLKQLNQDTHTHNLITRVIPIGKDNLDISSVNDGKMWLENHTYSNKVIYGVWQATDYDDATKLKEDAQRYLNEMAIPYESYEIQVTDIAKLGGNPNFRYELGDIITIIDNLTETRIKQRIYRKVYNLQDPDADIVNIASKDKSFEDYYKRIQTVADMTDKVINTDGTINSESIDKVPTDKLVGEILGTNIKADSITASHIKAEQIQAKHITADAISANHIKANAIQTNHLQANSITSGHIQADTITSSHIQSGAITAGNGIIADGAIGNAQISNLDASKLTAGTIDTSDITIAGANQNLRITGNRLQVFEGVGSSQKERVSLGDVNADGSVYGIRVRGKDGTTVLFDDNGVTKEGITDGSITNDKINPNANINASKIDIDSVINRINEDGSTTIQGTRIDIDNKSLSAVISEINTKNTTQDSTIASQASSITANTNAIKLKVDTQTYNTDKANMTTQMNKNTSDIDIMEGQIALKVEQTDIDSAINSMNSSVDTKIANAKSEIKVTTDSISNRVSSTETNVTNVTNNLNNLQIGGRNYIHYGKGDVKNGFFTKFDKVGNGYGEHTLTSQKTYTNVNIDSGFLLGCRDYEVGKQVTFSYEIMYTNWNFPTGTDRSEFWMGQRYTNATTQSSDGAWRGVTFHSLPEVGKNGCELNKWFKVEKVTTIPQQAHSSIGTASAIQFYNSNADVSASVTFRIRNVKIEYGNKATDWTPAPEDIQSQIDTNKASISTTANKVSTIETNLNSITSRVSSVETKTTSMDNKVTSHESRLSSAESKITADAIVSTVTSSTTYKNNLSGKVDTDKVVSSINQTAESIKINANKIQLEGATTVGSNNNYIKINDYRYTAYVNNKLAMEFGGYSEDNTFIPCLYMGANGFNASSSDSDGQYFALKNYGTYHRLTQRHTDGNWSIIEFNNNGNITITPKNVLDIAKDTSLVSSKSLHMYGGNVDCRNSSGSIGSRLNYQGLVTNQISNMSGGTVNIQGNLRSMYSSQTLGTSDGRWSILYCVSSPNVSSDSRLKENIRYVTDATTINELDTEVVTQVDNYNFVKDELNIAEYKYKCQDNNTFGFIAQDIVNTKVGSKIIHEDTEGYLAYDSGAYVNVLASALKETMNQVEQLKQEVAELKKAIQS